MEQNALSKQSTIDGILLREAPTRTTRKSKQKINKTQMKGARRRKRRRGGRGGSKETREETKK